ncbi:unnamed protein product [Vitrella brassicaformis CCMP3155]|uniref:Uncharacterized protein n=2 Tax=Vitrella brassicaformis TaxID=1169539 RepID=A0A0G4ETK4_VITBC|nr:unnamed protein product [Vitrella brassicaformis CCMP3155]|eukprot:CEM01774.1 unnamed protein product [Vitrella brassicaformis CCMP3155]
MARAPRRADRGQNADPLNHDDSMLMVPPPGYKFIPKRETVCGKPGCFECFDIYCERCEMKDRRIVELEMRNNDLVKYITLLQGRIFGTRAGAAGGSSPSGAGLPGSAVGGLGATPGGGGGTKPPLVTGEPFAFIQSPVLYDPHLNISYIATTTFSPAPHDEVLKPEGAGGGMGGGGSSANPVGTWGRQGG